MNTSVAIVGYGVRAPGASTVDDFWSVTSTKSDQLSRSLSNVGVRQGGRVSAYGRLHGWEQFAASRFGYSEREAREIDPQQRLLLECACEALEMGALAGDVNTRDIGVFVSVGDNGYGHGLKSSDSTPLSSLLGGDPHYAATRIAYKLGLTGPAISVGTACSSSLVAVHLAVQSILSGECDAAIAGGMDIEYPQPSTYVWAEGGILSKSGAVRPFDQRADGVVFGSGGAAALLVSLDVAQDLGLPIRSIIHGSAINNDGHQKASFTAPSANRQAAVLKDALDLAGLNGAAISYYEAHGTATAIGDESELRAASEAYKTGAHSIALGSVKANIGHLRVGAGIVGLVKASEVVYRGRITPIGSADSPAESLEQTPFYVPSETESIDLPPALRFAGVSSFGFGGTNANVVIGGYETQRTTNAPEPTSNRFRFSGTTPEEAYGHAAAVLGAVAAGLVSASDASHTLETGWTDLDYRLAFRSAPSTISADAEQLELGLPVPNAVEGWRAPIGETVLLLPGQGTSLNKVAQSLMADHMFANDLQQIWAGASESMGEELDLGDVLVRPQTAARISHTLHVAIEIALGNLLRRSGIHVDRFVGFSLGEFAAAALAGALETAEALRMAALRGRQLDASEATGDLFLTTATLPDLQTIIPAARLAINYGDRSGYRAIAIPSEDLPTLRQLLDETDPPIRGKLLGLGHAYHSEYMASVAAALPRTRSVSEAGRFTALTRGAAWNEEYWRQHLTAASEASPETVGGRDDVVIDLTPKAGTSRLIGFDGRVVQLFGGEADDAIADVSHAINAYWVLGGELHQTIATRPRVSLPARPLSRERFVERETLITSTHHASANTKRAESTQDWVYQPSWRLRRVTPIREDVRGQRWLVFSTPSVENDEIVARIRDAGVEAEVVSFGENMPAGDEKSISDAMTRLVSATRPVDRLVHLSSLAPQARATQFDDEITQIEEEQDLGFYSILFGTQQLARLQGARALEIDIISRGAHPADADVHDRIPARALLNGPTLVIPQDFPFVSTRSIDVTGSPDDRVPELVIDELLSSDKERVVALSSGRRWVRGFERDTLPTADGDARRLRYQGVYLITGGLGGIGMTIAEFLARKYQARLVLTALDSVPSDDEVRAGETAPEFADDEIRRTRIDQIRSLEALGAKVMARPCDAGDLSGMKSLIAEVEERWGGLHGVVHAAGVFETQRAFRPLSDTGREDCERRLHPKVRATVVLDYLLRGRRLDFVLMQSSLSAHLGGLGFYAYTAGNSFMDAYAERANRPDFPSMSVNWDGWVFHERDTDPERSVIDPSFASPDFGVVAEIAIRPSEGAALYEQLMSLEDIHPVLISTADFDARVRQWVAPRPATDDTVVTSLPVSKPAASDYEGIQARVVEVLRDVTGSTRITPDDNFFGLGGDSLLGVTLGDSSGHAGAQAWPLRASRRPVMRS